MLKELLELGKGLADLFRQGRQQADKIRKLEEEVTELDQMVRHLAIVVHELSRQREHDRELAVKDREKDAVEQERLRLQLENTLLRFERRLPPGSPSEGTPEIP